MGDWLLGKSAKMWVNEICVRQLVRPDWATREAHPGQQPPTFICSCTIKYTDKRLLAEGTGKTKKDAEQAAALSMLKDSDKLGMTPFKLQNFNSNSNAKRKPEASLSSASKPLSVVSSGKGTEEEMDVSDTDDRELEQSLAETGYNPISELAAICDQNELVEPDYDMDVNQEGPPHRRVFTVSCSVPSLNISFQGRRHTKKMGKRMAAYRVLREIKKLGYKYIQHTENGEGEDEDDGDVSEPKMEQVVIDTSSGKEPMTVNRLKGNINDTAEAMKAHYSGGSRLYCNDVTEKCLKLCVDYPHVYHHLPKSDTLDIILAKCGPGMDTYPTEFGAPIPLLQKISKEMRIKLRMYCQTVASYEIVTFLELKLHFTIKRQIPNKAVVHATGVTEAESKNNAAKKAIKLLTFFTTTS